MLLSVHIISALFGILFSTLAYCVPTKTKLNVTYLFIFMTVTTGSILTVYSQANIAKVCFSGLFYLGLVGYLSVKGWKKLPANHKYEQ